MEMEESQIKKIYLQMKKEDPTLTIDRFIKAVRESGAAQVNETTFERYALQMLLSTREEVKEEKKEPIQMV